MFYFAALPVTFLTLTLFLQLGIELAPVFAGMVTIPFALASAATSFASGRVVHLYGRRIVTAGLALVLLGLGSTVVAAFVVPVDALPWVVAVTMGIAGAGGGAVIAPNQTLALAEVPVTSGGVAGSIQQVAQRVGTAVGIAAGTAAFYATIYAERGEFAELVVFQDAFRNASAVALLLLTAALITALVDLRARQAGRITVTT